MRTMPCKTCGNELIVATSSEILTELRAHYGGQLQMRDAIDLYRAAHGFRHTVMSAAEGLHRIVYPYCNWT